jgi:hypothetical protein
MLLMDTKCWAAVTLIFAVIAVISFVGMMAMAGTMLALMQP